MFDAPTPAQRAVVPLSLQSTRVVEGLSILTVLLLTIWYIQRKDWNRRCHGFPVPPGPRPLPVIGNFLDLEDVKHPWLVYQKWAETYGDITFLRILRTPMIIINSSAVAHDLMEKRSAIYSDKPAFTIDELTGWDFSVAAMPYGQRWRTIRRTFHQYFNQFATLHYRSKQRREVHGLLRRLVDSQGKAFDPSSIRHTLAAVIMDVVYAHKISGVDDEYINAAYAAAEVVHVTRTPGKFWVDYMPLIKYIPSWVPGAAASQFAESSYPIVQKMINQPFDMVKDKSFPDDCVVRDLLRRLDQMEDREDLTGFELQARHATAIAYAAGVDTTFALLVTFFCVMAMHPDVQVNAQKELEQVVGPHRLPEFDDHDSLPYVQAILLECLRWLPVFPLGIQHQALVDDYYNGYFIPKGTIVTPNVWAMTHNSREYPDPNAFKPERWLKNGQINKQARDRLDLVFGFGRRICPGRYFAKDNAFMTVASVLHTFSITPILDESGHPVDPTFEPTTGLVSLPDRVRCTVKLRSEAAERLIKASTANM